MPDFKEITWPPKKIHPLYQSCDHRGSNPMFQFRSSEREDAR